MVGKEKNALGGSHSALATPILIERLEVARQFCMLNTEWYEKRIKEFTRTKSKLVSIPTILVAERMKHYYNTRAYDLALYKLTGDCLIPNNTYVGAEEGLQTLRYTTTDMLMLLNQYKGFNLIYWNNQGFTSWLEEKARTDNEDLPNTEYLKEDELGIFFY
jgi:hypothetical protein